MASAPIVYSRVPAKDYDLNRVQDSIQRVTDGVNSALGDADTQPDGIVRVDTASGTSTYTVKDGVKHVVFITNGGAISCVLPAPKVKRTLGVIANGKNAATVKRIDGKAMSFGASKSLTNAAALFVADGTDWYLG